MEQQRTGLFVALLLLSPIAAGMSLIPTFVTTRPVVQTLSAKTVVSYTSVLASTEFGSTLGSTLALSPLNLPPKVVGFMAPAGKCSQFTWPLSLASGTVLNLKLVSSNPANLYLLQTYSVQASGNGCSASAPALLSEINFTSYTLHWAVPDSGTFYILLTGPTTVILLTDQGSTRPVFEMSNITYGTSTQTSFEGYASTSTATYTTTLGQQLYLQPNIQSTLAAIVLLAICVGMGIVLVRRGKRA